MTEPADFVAGGTPEEQLMGMCETLWEPNMSPDALFECTSQVYFNFFSLLSLFSVFFILLLGFFIFLLEDIS